MKTRKKEELETFQASAARIERPRKTDEKWKNPTKIMKKPEPPKEKKLAVPKAMRSSNWKLAMVKDDMELDNEGEEDGRRCPRTGRRQP